LGTQSCHTFQYASPSLGCLVLSSRISKLRQAFSKQKAPWELAFTPIPKELCLHVM
jgi:hypothetical protein